MQQLYTHSPCIVVAEEFLILAQYDKYQDESNEDHSAASGIVILIKPVSLDEKRDPDDPSYESYDQKSDTRSKCVRIEAIVLKTALILTCLIGAYTNRINVAVDQKSPIYQHEKRSRQLRKTKPKQAARPGFPSVLGTVGQRIYLLIDWRVGWRINWSIVSADKRMIGNDSVRRVRKSSGIVGWWPREDTRGAGLDGLVRINDLFVCGWPNRSRISMNCLRRIVLEWLKSAPCPGQLLVRLFHQVT